MTMTMTRNCNISIIITEAKDYRDIDSMTYKKEVFAINHHSEIIESMISKGFTVVEKITEPHYEKVVFVK